METEIAHLLHQLKHLLNKLPTQTGNGSAPGLPAITYKYYNDMVQYIDVAEIESNCVEVSIYNQGTSNLIVNGILFLPNTGIAFDGKEGEMDTTKYKIHFSGAGQNQAFVIRKVYVQ
jgi:hypothetical protein